MGTTEDVSTTGRIFLNLQGRTVYYDEILNDDIIGKAAELRPTFRSARPFPHIVFDGLFSADLLDIIWHDFGNFGANTMKARQSDREVTFRSRSDVVLPASVQIYFDKVNSGRFVKFLTEVTGISGLVTDPFFQRGGLHESREGGKFQLHLDFSKHPVTDLDNRLVLITYLNSDWREEFGGALELWSVAEDRCVTKVIPEVGRSILFEQSAVSLHGHPTPVKTPDNRPRRSLATYYYSNCLDDRAAELRYNTHFRSDPDETTWARTMKAVKYVLPPILIDAGRLLKSAGWHQPGRYEAGDPNDDPPKGRLLPHRSGNRYERKDAEIEARY